MLHTLTSLLSERFGDRAFSFAIIAAALGVFVWLLGARFGKSVLALIGVGLGAWVGMNLPRWYGWQFDGMALGMGCALVAGFMAYLLHTSWVGTSLLANLAILFALTAWAIIAGNEPWTAPTIADPTVGHAQILRALWGSMPGTLPRVMPYAVGGGVVVAALLSVFWPRAAKGLSWSLIGIGLMFFGGAVALKISRPTAELSTYLPAAAGARVGLLWALAIAGSLVQWWALPDAESTPKAAPSPLEEKPIPSSSDVRGGRLFIGGGNR
jgi:hypothetical protein